MKGTVNKSQSEQLVFGSTSIPFIMRKNWIYPLTASWFYRRLDDEIWVNFEILYRLRAIQSFTCLISVQCYYSITDAFQLAFLKYSQLLRCVSRYRSFGSHRFSFQSLLYLMIKFEYLISSISTTSLISTPMRYYLKTNIIMIVVILIM